MNVIVTGYAGFIGFHLTKKLLNFQNINQILCIDNFNNYYEVDLKYARHNEIANFDTKKKCIFFKIDISNKKKLFDKMNNFKIDYIFNLAAQAGINYSVTHPEKYIKSNIIGFFNIIELSKEKKIKTLFYASTSSVYGNLNKKKYAEKDLNNKPLQLYAATKISNEVLSKAYSNLYHFNSIGLRFFTVYGSWGRPDMAIFKFCKNILNNSPIIIYRNKNKPVFRDFTYVDDIVNSITLLFKEYSKQKYKNLGLSEVFNIGNGSPVNIEKMISYLETLLNKKSIKSYQSLKNAEMIKTSCDNKKLYSKIKFSPKVDIQSGLRKFVSWYKKYYNDKY